MDFYSYKKFSLLANSPFFYNYENSSLVDSVSFVLMKIRVN
jgi:hypothetical protein